MIYFLYEKSSGRIYSATTFLTENLNNDYSVIESELPITAGSSYYVADNQLVSMPDKPNEYCIFDYTTKQWVDIRTVETQWTIIREERNMLLQSTDWTQLADIPFATKSLWEPYRQTLRDITLQSDPFSIVWPIPPL